MSITIEVEGLGELHLVGEADSPRGRDWSNRELAALRSVAPTRQEALAVAEVKDLFEGAVVGAHQGDRGPAVELELGMPHSTPTQRTKRFLDRGHGPRPVSPYAAARKTA